MRKFAVFAFFFSGAVLFSVLTENQILNWLLSGLCVLGLPFFFLPRFRARRVRTFLLWAVAGLAVGFMRCGLWHAVV